MKQLYRSSEQAARFQEILSPHLKNIPDRDVFTSRNDPNKKFTMQIPADETLELKFLQIESRHGANAGSTIVFVVGGLILMGVGVGLASKSSYSQCKEEEAEQAAT